jgi:predicted Rossmann-fold nucleotide-binding protein
VRGYFAPLVTLVERAVVEGFVAAENRGLLVVASDVRDLLAQMRTYVTPRGFRPLIRPEET